MLRRGQVITKPYGSSIFQINFFCISDSRFRFLMKKYLHKLFLFFQYSYRNMVKIEKNRHFTYLFELTSIFHSFFYFWQCSHQNFEKIRPVCVHTFSRGIWIWNQNCKKMNLENWLPIGVGFLSDPGATWRFHFFSILTLWSDSSPSKPNLRGRHNKNSNFDEKKN